MAITRLYDTCFEKIRQLRPQEHVSRVRNISRLMAGLFMSGCVHLSYIARKIPGTVQQASKIKMLSRLLNNPHIRVRDWYDPIARELLATANQYGPLYLMVDGTKVGNGHQLLMVALVYHKRTLPIAWTWVKGTRGHSSASRQCALLSYVRRLTPADATVFIAGDSEFGAITVLQQLEQWGWDYALRQKGQHLIQRTTTGDWQRCDSLVTRSSDCCWLENINLTQAHAHPTNFLAYWKRGEKEPWLLATSLSTAAAAKKLYRKRMLIEEMFGDFKQHGFDLECSRLEHFLALSRLTLVVALLYYWLVIFGSQAIKDGKRFLVDRRNRRDLSIFRIGFDLLERCLLNSEPIFIRAVPYFQKVYGS